MACSFLQTNTAARLRTLVVDSESLSDFDRNLISSFLSGSSEYAPQSGQIVGILKQMGDTMAKDLADITATEETAKTSYAELMAAKTKEVEALTKAIEEKTIRVGDLGVEIATNKEDL